MTSFSLKQCVLPATFLISSLIWSTTSLADCHKQLVHGWGGYWEPFVLGTPEKPDGLDMEILDAVVNASGCTWKNTSKVIPWSRHLQQIESGILDLATSASWTQERADYAFFTQPYRSEYVALFVRANRLEELKPLSIEKVFERIDKIGAERSNSYGPSVDTLLKEKAEKVELIMDNNQNITKLMYGRIDGYLGFLPYDSILLETKGLDNQIAALPATISKSGDVHIMLSKKSTDPAVLNALNNGLDQIKKDGTYAKILKKYNDKYGNEYW